MILLALPEEAIVYTFSFLDAVDLGRIVTVCKDFYRFANESTLWMGLAQRTWNFEPIDKNIEWKFYYITKTLLTSEGNNNCTCLL